MNYEQLDQDYRDDAIASALFAREMEFFHYDLDRANFEEMLKTLPDGEYRDSIQKHLQETLLQMDRVERVYSALKAQITDPVAHDNAVRRTTQKRMALLNNVPNSSS